VPNVAPTVETAPASSSERPRVLWGKPPGGTAAGASTGPTPRVFSIKHLGKYYGKSQGDAIRRPIKVNQAFFDAAPLDQRELLEVVHTSDSESAGGSRVDISSDASGQSDDDDQPEDHSSSYHQQLLAPPPVTTQRPTRSVRKPAPPPPPPPPPPPQNPSQLDVHAAESSLTALAVKLAAADGSCLFDATSRALRHILQMDLGAFNMAQQRSAQIAIAALTDPEVLRKLTCAHLLGHLPTSLARAFSHSRPGNL